METHYVHLSFCIWNYENASHEEISTMLGLTPSKVYIAGERKNPNFSALSKHNGWILDAPQFTENKNSSFEEQLNSIISIFFGKSDIVKKISAKYYCELSCGVYLYIDINDSTPAMHITTQQQQFLSELNIEVDIDIIHTTSSS